MLQIFTFNLKNKTLLNSLDKTTQNTSLDVNSAAEITDNQNKQGRLVVFNCDSLQEVIISIVIVLIHTSFFLMTNKQIQLTFPGDFSFCQPKLGCFPLKHCLSNKDSADSIRPSIIYLPSVKLKINKFQNIHCPLEEALLLAVMSQY